ncbi:hypothetical protein glysoja_034267 [Glycine soja]|uniref:Uncharacterized protein n=1 Tax=Glycine soja TaxID=3848 RepID=A0A0B2PNE2_GLYSO|nr:hypothetical protein glysoja_034267 [Glycine soja]
MAISDAVARNFSTIFVGLMACFEAYGFASGRRPRVPFTETTLTAKRMCAREVSVGTASRRDPQPLRSVSDFPATFP